ncbi:serine hydrolase [Nannocystis pusilla]|uniref:serine hydrolase n=1 Tax=Nannocystis pusilla TaxID=889268 RepID=UPI003BF3538A
MRVNSRARRCGVARALGECARGDIAPRASEVALSAVRAARAPSECAQGGTAQSQGCAPARLPPCRWLERSGASPASNHAQATFGYERRGRIRYRRPTIRRAGAGRARSGEFARPSWRTPRAGLRDAGDGARGPCRRDLLPVIVPSVRAVRPLAGDACEDSRASSSRPSCWPANRRDLRSPPTIASTRGSTRFGYANPGFMALGRIVEHVSGEAYDDYVKTHIFAPAGMHATAAVAWDEVAPNLAVGYGREDSAPLGLRPRRTNVSYLPFSGTPAGGGYSSVELLAVRPRE